MEITYNGTFTFTEEQKSLLERTIIGSCAESGYKYTAELRNVPNLNMIVITICPPERSHFVSFHIRDLQIMENVLCMNFRFCELYNGRLELTFIK